MNLHRGWFCLCYGGPIVVMPVPGRNRNRRWYRRGLASRFGFDPIKNKSWRLAVVEDDGLSL